MAAKHPYVVTSPHGDRQDPYYWLRDDAHKTDSQPMLFRTNMEAGHGGKSGRFSRLGEIAQEYAFILDLLEQSK